METPRSQPVSATVRYAILLDGEYIKKRLSRQLGRRAQAADIIAHIQEIRDHHLVAGLSLYRIFYYTADPVAGTATHPLSKTIVDFTATETFRYNSSLLQRRT